MCLIFASPLKSIHRWWNYSRTSAMNGKMFQIIPSQYYPHELLCICTYKMKLESSKLPASVPLLAVCYFTVMYNLLEKYLHFPHIGYICFQKLSSLNSKNSSIEDTQFGQNICLIFCATNFIYSSYRKNTFL